MNLNGKLLFGVKTPQNRPKRREWAFSKRQTHKILKLIESTASIPTKFCKAIKIIKYSSSTSYRADVQQLT